MISVSGIISLRSPYLGTSCIPYYVAAVVALLAVVGAVAVVGVVAVVVVLTVVAVW